MRTLLRRAGATRTSRRRTTTDVKRNRTVHHGVYHFGDYRCRSDFLQAAEEVRGESSLLKGGSASGGNLSSSTKRKEKNPQKRICGLKRRYWLSLRGASDAQPDPEGGNSVCAPLRFFTFSGAHLDAYWPYQYAKNPSPFDDHGFRRLC